MGEFKPMVKMMTTEPSVELKLKKGGSATHKRMHAEGAKAGFKPVKKMNGGSMGNAALTSLPASNPVAARAMSARKMMANPPKPTPPIRNLPRNPTQVTGTVQGMGPGGNMPKGVGPTDGGNMPKPVKGGPAMPVVPRGGLNPMIMRKKGGGVGAELKKHESMPASKAHMGLKTGGIAKSTKPGGYKTGGVVNGQGGFKKGGSVPADGIIKTMASKTTKVVGAKPDNNSAPTGDVKMGNAGGYKKGGAAKKHFATGGVVDSGHAVAMPKKAPSKPVAISELSGTFKKGGRVC